MTRLLYGGLTKFNRGVKKLSDIIAQFRHIKILTWLRGLGELNKINKLFIPHPRCDFFCFIPLSLGAKLEF